MIRETITFTFRDEAQRDRFHEELRRRPQCVQAVRDETILDRIGGALQDGVRTGANYTDTDLATIAILALREPTENMVEAGCRAFTETLHPDGPNMLPTAALWQAMIDAAIAEDAMK